VRHRRQRLQVLDLVDNLVVEARLRVGVLVAVVARAVLQCLDQFTRLPLRLLAGRRERAVPVAGDLDVDPVAFDGEVAGDHDRYPARHRRRLLGDAGCQAAELGGEAGKQQSEALGHSRSLRCRGAEGYFRRTYT